MEMALFLTPSFETVQLSFGDRAMACRATQYLLFSFNTVSSFLLVIIGVQLEGQANP